MITTGTTITAIKLVVIAVSVAEISNDPATHRTNKPRSPISNNGGLDPNPRTNKKTYTQPETEKLLMALNDAIKKADILGLIDYLEGSPEYGEPTETGAWLFKIRFDLIQLINITTNQQTEKENN